MMGRSIRESLVAQLLVVMAVGSVIQIVVGGFVSGLVAGDHAQFHAATALVVALIGLAIVLRWPASGAASRLPALGLGALAAAWLVESLGGYGFGPDNDTRVNAFVLLHDLGLGLVGLGMLAAVAGVAAGIVVAGRRRTGPAQTIIVVGAIGVFVVGFVTMLALTGMLPIFG
jgi:hypothetical protein